MAMTETAGQLDLEPRWPIILTIIVVFALTLLPGRVRAFPPWARVLVVVVLIAPMAGLWLSPAKQRWLQIESIVTAAFVLIAGAGMILDLKDLFVRMVTPPTGITGIQLLPCGPRTCSSSRCSTAASIGRHCCPCEGNSRRTRLALPS